VRVTPELQPDVWGTFRWTPVRLKRNGGPEPHAAKDGWIALRRDRHIPPASTIN